MDFSLDFLLAAAQFALQVIFFGTLGLYLTTLGSPRSLYQSVLTIRDIDVWPSTALFRWRKVRRHPYHLPDPSTPPERDGYEVFAYNHKTEKEEQVPGILHLAKFCPTFLLWPKKRPQQKRAMMRIARVTLLIRVFFFVAFFLGAFTTLAWLAFTRDWRWFIALGVLAVHQLAFYRTNTYFVWLKWWLLLVIGLGSWFYRQGAPYETPAICVVAVLLTLAIIGQWHMVTSLRFERMRNMEYGPFDPGRRRGRPF
jgi:hypothetical protein